MTVSSTELSEALATHCKAIVSYSCGIVGDDGEAKDLAQETLLCAYNKLSTLEDPTRLGPPGCQG